MRRDEAGTLIRRFRVTNRARLLLCGAVVFSGLFPACAGAEQPPMESSCLVLAKGADGTVRAEPLGSLHVLASTSRAGKFELPPDAPASPTGILCGRSSLIPGPNDYKVLLAGLSLGISRNDEPNGRVGVLEMVSGKLQFRMIDGILTEEEMKVLQRRLEALQRQVDNPT
jgi:hypothetical protein